MSELIHVRPQDTVAPKPPILHDDDVTLEKPPETPRKVKSPVGVFAPLLIVAGVGAMVYVGMKNGNVFHGAWGFLPMTMMIGVMMLFRSRRGASQTDTPEDRANYARHLDTKRNASIASAETQFEVAEFHFPPPDQLAGRVGEGRRKEDDENGVTKSKPSYRMWERRRRNPSSKFGEVRIGRGEERARLKFNTLQIGALIDQEPACAQMVSDLIAEQSFVRDIPRAISLTEQGGWFCTGDLAAARNGVRAMVMHAAFFHGPDDFGIAVITSEDRSREWDWVKWLPHHRHGARNRPMTYSSAAEFLTSMGESYSARGKLNTSVLKQTNLADAAGDGAAPVASSRHLLVICDSEWIDWSALLRDGQESGVEGVCFLVVGSESSPLRTPTTTLIYDGPERILRADSNDGRPRFLAVPDQAPLWLAEPFARRMAAYRPGSSASALLDASDDQPKLRLGSLIGIEDWANFDPVETWKWCQNRRNALRVPVGQFIDSGRPFFFDLSDGPDAAGPHFMLGGSTGWGKSEFLRVLTLALVCTHSPQDLVIYPADFKGNITFRGFEAIPHVPMVLHNLEQSPDTIQRLVQVLMGELERRQRLLDHAGDLAAQKIIKRAPVNIEEYRALCARRPDLNLEPMPYLFMPFDELMMAKRQFPQLLNIIKIACTVGRSLGVRLGVVSQELNENLMSGIETHMTGRVTMRMNNPKDYRPVIGTSNPGSLPARKGAGYYARSLNAPPQRIQGAFVSGTYVPPVPVDESQPDEPEVNDVRPRLLTGFRGVVWAAWERTFGGGAADDETVAEVAEEIADEAGSEDGDEGGEDDQDISATDMGMGIAVLQKHGGTIDHNPWKPELQTHLPMADAVATYLRELNPESAAHLFDWYDGHPGRYVPDMVQAQSTDRLDLVAPCGVIDRPRDHEQDVLAINLRQNTALAGGLQTGKSTALLSMIMGASALFSSERVQFYCIDSGGGVLQSALTDLDHVGAVVAGDGDRYPVARMVNHVEHVMKERSSSWSLARINSADEWRKARFGGPANAGGVDGRRGDVPDDGYGDVFLVIDGFDRFWTAYPEHQDTIKRIAASGPNRGVHLVVSTSSWHSGAGTFRLWDDFFLARYELRMEDPTNSNMGGTDAAMVPHMVGRGMIASAGTGRARRGTVQVSGGDTVPAVPTRLHTLYFAPQIVTPEREVVSMTDDPKAVGEYLNSLHPGSRPAPRMPELPDRVTVADIMATNPPPAPAGSILLGQAETDGSPFYWNPAQQSHLAVVASKSSGRTGVLRLVGAQLQQLIDASPEAKKPLVLVFDQNLKLANVVPGAIYVHKPSQVAAAVAKVNAILATRSSDEEIDQTALAARRDSGHVFDGPEVFVLINNLTDWVSGLQDPFGWDGAVESGAFIGFHVVVTRIADPSLATAWQNRGIMAAIRRINAPMMMMNSPSELVNVVGKFRGQPMVKGRGLVVDGDSNTTIQVALPDGVELLAPNGDRGTER